MKPINYFGASKWVGWCSCATHAPENSMYGWFLGFSTISGSKSLNPLSPTLKGLGVGLGWRVGEGACGWGGCGGLLNLD